jgi:hypothetical protein
MEEIVALQALEVAENDQMLPGGDADAGCCSASGDTETDSCCGSWGCGI